MALARGEAVQPSLWDRFQNDLPELLADIAAIQSKLVELEPQIDLDEILAAGEQGLLRRNDLDEDSYQLALGLIRKTHQSTAIANSGIVVTSDVLREAVRRDIEMLFNVERLEAEYLVTDREEQITENLGSLLRDFPEVRKSVVNFGVPAFAGRKSSDFDQDILVRDLRRVLQTYETRLKPDSIKVKVSGTENAGLRVDIDTVLLLSPVPERLRLSTTVDMDTGQATTVIERD